MCKKEIGDVETAEKVYTTAVAASEEAPDKFFAADFFVRLSLNTFAACVSCVACIESSRLASALSSAAEALACTTWDTCEMP
jgi:hypothetical protein